jgi:hypothetical protein
MRRFLKDYWALLIIAALAAPIVWMGRTDILSAQPVLSNTIRFVDAPSGSPPSLLATGIDANIGLTLTPKGTGVVTIGGPLSAPAVTQQIFINAGDACYADNTATPMIRVRIATGDWALARTAAGAETQNIECSFVLPQQVTANKGYRIDNFSLVHQITVVNLTTATFQQLSTTVYANNVANAVAQYGGAPTITMPTVVQANPYVTAATLAAPAFQNTTNAQVTVDWQVVMANTGVYRVYGVIVNLTRAIY